MKPLLRLTFPHLLASIALAATATPAPAQQQTAKLVKDANRTPAAADSAIWVMPVGTAKNVVFSMDTIPLGSELWISDGTPKRTRLLKEFVPGPDSHSQRFPTAFGGSDSAKVAFTVDDSEATDDVWATDGTEAGTVRIFDSTYDQGNGLTTVWAGIPGGFFFEDYPSNQDHNRALYFSDGTEAGTWLLNPPLESTRERFTNPRPFTYVTDGQRCYFIANGREVWRSDGTPAGTAKVVTIPDASGTPETIAVAGSRLFLTTHLDGKPQLLRCPTAGGDLTTLTPPEAATWSSIELQDGASIDDDVFFISHEQGNARSLWASDGFHSGTRRIPLMHPGQSADSDPHAPLVRWKGHIYMAAYDPENDHELWRSDGTEAGTTRVKAGVDLAIPTHQQPDSSEYFYFHAWDEDDGSEPLWQTKGDEASTQLVKKAPDCIMGYDQGPQFAHTESGLIFSGAQYTPDAALYRVKNKNGGAIKLTKSGKANGDGIPSYSELPYEMLDGKLLEFVNTGKGHELWSMRPNGTGARSLWKVPAGTLDVGGRVGFHGIIPRGAIFSLTDADGKFQLWITNGKPRGTRMLTEHANLYDPYPFIKLGNLIFYRAPDPASPEQMTLWKTDGTADGTLPVVTENGSTPAPDPREMVVFQGSLYFLSTGDGTNGKTALWRSDGTADGTVLIKDEWQGEPGEKARNLSTAAGKLYLAVRLSTADTLWESDGTTGGTMITNPLLNFARFSVGTAVDLNGVAVFQARGALDSHVQWWRHSGNETRPVRDSLTGPHLVADSTYPLQQAVIGNQLFYPGYSEDSGHELWVTDGTSAGSRLVKDLNPGPASSAPDSFVVAGNTIYFRARDQEYGTRLWHSDGTEAGTAAAGQFQPGLPDSIAYGLKAMGGKLYFYFPRRDIGAELHYIDLPQE